jgi:hypothetical protein
MTRPWKLLIVAAALALSAAAGCGGQEAARTARVPRVGAGELITVGEAYDRLRAAGLRVEIRGGFHVDMRDGPLSAAPRPGSGTPVEPGSVVSIAPTGGPHLDVVRREPPHPTAVPDLTGMSANAFFAWTDGSGADWGAEVSALPPTSRPHLWDNYRVARQLPAAGTRLSVDSGTGFLEPVEVWLEPV